MIKKAINHLKKLSLRGGKDELYANFATRKFPDQKSVEKVSKTKARKILFCIIFNHLQVSLMMTYQTYFLLLIGLYYKTDPQFQLLAI